MGRLTYYVALAFVRGEDGSLIPGEPKEAPNADAAIRAATALSWDKDKAGAIAFSRTGDPDLGEYDPAVVLKRIGETPDDLTEL